MQLTLDDLRRLTIVRSLFRPTTLKRALDRMGFVQADPIRAPARAQDLTLRHRVQGYRAGDLERRFASLGIEEDFFFPYGFVTSSVQALMHPRREGRRPWSEARKQQAQVLLDFVRARGEVHPREVDAHFAHGTVRNCWGGSSIATTDLLAAMHYRGLLRVARREGGIRVYAAHAHAPAPTDSDAIRARIDALVDVILRLYAPLPGKSLSSFVSALRFAVPQWRGELKGALHRAKERLVCAGVDSANWYWPAGERAAASTPHDTVRLLAPFDPVVRDRVRFELLWGWEYRFEAYTSPPRRKRGYYALPLLWRDRVIGWANLSVKNRELESEFGYVGSGPPRDRAFRRELSAELDHMRSFLRLEA
jgi:uncharacterized protein YcaQ